MCVAMIAVVSISKYLIERSKVDLKTPRRAVLQVHLLVDFGDGGRIWKFIIVSVVSFLRQAFLADRALHSSVNNSMADV